VTPGGLEIGGVAVVVDEDAEDVVEVGEFDERSGEPGRGEDAARRALAAFGVAEFPVLGQQRGAGDGEGVVEQRDGGELGALAEVVRGGERGGGHGRPRSIWASLTSWAPTRRRFLAAATTRAEVAIVLILRGTPAVAS